MCRRRSSTSTGATGSLATRCTTVRFRDIDVLLYAAGVHPEDPARASVAREVLTARDLCLSVQVLQEFYVQATRPSRPRPLTVDQASRLLRSLRRFPVQPLTAKIVTSAVRLHERHRISYWDAAIVEAARRLGCTTVLSEDLAAGQDYGGVLVVNPFAAA